MKMILVRCVLELTVRHNLHFFNHHRCYLLLFAERRNNKPHHNKFHTDMVHIVNLIEIYNDVSISTRVSVLYFNFYVEVSFHISTTW